ncbi:hypothetical protein E2562_031987 [Oryza meyeriana var. granulata]|uniref:Uncharacterized protein n=1 Tax=Oryza meyeriana var. granulata TaxID=110450 RepID=A0A6G1F0B9_9ORYZ|nr:hypothetical protein E2562_031987 [Oryza meyeriana var. granulata]
MALYGKGLISQARASSGRSRCSWIPACIRTACSCHDEINKCVQIAPTACIRTNVSNSRL